MSEEARAVVAFVERPADGRILCVWNKRYGGWGMPGGKVEESELVTQALERELSEETGCSIYGRPEPIYDAPHKTKPVEGVTGRGSRVLVFRIRISGDPREMEHGCPVTWLTRDEFLEWSPFSEFYREMFEVLYPAKCTCAEIQRQDPKRHFKGCALRMETRVEWTCKCRTLLDGSDRVTSADCPVHSEITVERFTEAILHGDDKHRAWLKAASAAFLAGKPIPDDSSARENESARASAFEVEHARLLSLLDRDRTGMGSALSGIANLLRGWDWLGEEDSWGSYSHDEHNTETLRREFRCLSDSVNSMIRQALADSGARADHAFYPLKPDRAAALDDLLQTVLALQNELAALKAPTLPFPGCCCVSPTPRTVCSACPIHGRGGEARHDVGHRSVPETEGFQERKDNG